MSATGVSEFYKTLKRLPKQLQKLLLHLFFFLNVMVYYYAYFNTNWIVTTNIDHQVFFVFNHSLQVFQFVRTVYCLACLLNHFHQKCFTFSATIIQ